MDKVDLIWFLILAESGYNAPATSSSTTIIFMLVDCGDNGDREAFRDADVREVGRVAKLQRVQIELVALHQQLRMQHPCRLTSRWSKLCTI